MNFIFFLFKTIFEPPRFTLSEQKIQDMDGGYSATNSKIIYLKIRLSLTQKIYFMHIKINIFNNKIF